MGEKEDNGGLRVWGLIRKQIGQWAMAHPRCLLEMSLTAGVCPEALAHRGCYSEGEEERGRGDERDAVPG